MVVSAVRPSVHPRTGIYQFRKVVPERLRSLIGKREVKVSLGTRDPVTARRLHAEMAAQIEADWAEQELAAANGEAPPKSLSSQEIDALAGRLYHLLMSRYGDDPVDRDYWLGKLRQAQAVLSPASEIVQRPFGNTYAFTPSSMAARLVGGRVSEMLETSRHPDRSAVALTVAHVCCGCLGAGLPRTCQASERRHQPRSRCGPLPRTQCHR
ncbi:DUF6538 domain-containing protein [Devosia aurantiaca]|uniref:DUF6538 domain-containing protein n=1 Tax=Devosia aurantiaca TaxID=2714858 RepID=UPI002E29BF30|nr:DUF6538 domain-containing protein [Devosia aurantiaca]